MAVQQVKSGVYGGIDMELQDAMMTVAVSSRALFHLEEENDVFEKGGERAFNKYMLERENVTLEPGTAFHLVRKLLGLNTDGIRRVEVVMLSRNSPAAGLRVMRSVRDHGLEIVRAVFCQGTDRFRYAKALGASLFLSANQSDVEGAVRNGVAAATMVPARKLAQSDHQVRMAFDGDAVLFGDSGDRIFQSVGLAKWREHEVDNAAVPLEDGPFRGVIDRLHRIRESLEGENSGLLRLALVTARGAPAHERALLTLRSWGIDMDEAIFCAGRDKGPLLRAFGADVLFDDGQRNIDSASLHEISAGKVPMRDCGEMR